MNAAQALYTSEARDVLRARFRMGLYLLMLFALRIVEAYLSVPFVDHTTSTQNVIYGFVVSAPFYITIAVFMLVAWKDLSTSTEGA